MLDCKKERPAEEHGDGPAVGTLSGGARISRGECLGGFKWSSCCVPIPQPTW